MKVKIFLILFSISSILECLTGILRGYASFQISSLIGFILYLLLTLYFLNKYHEKLNSFLIFSAILLGLCLIQLPLRILSFKSTLVSLPDFIFHLSGVLFGLLLFKVRPVYSLSITGIWLVILLYMCFNGYNIWLHKLNFGTFTGIVQETAPNFTIPLSEGKYLSNNSIKEKLIVFDFWHTACGVCFTKFPTLQSKFDKYKNTKGVEFYAVDIHLKRDSVNQASSMIKNLKYTFPVLVINDSSAKAFNVQCVPTTLIIQNGKNIIYRGDIEGIDKTIENFKNGH